MERESDTVEIRRFGVGRKKERKHSVGEIWKNMEGRKILEMG